MHRDDNGASAGRVGQGDKFGRHFTGVLHVGAKEVRNVLAFFKGNVVIEPAHGGVIVVGAGVDDAVLGRYEANAAVGAIDHGEMKHLHARETAVAAQFIDGVGDDTQVLRHDGHGPQRLGDSVEEGLARPLAPRAVNGGSFGARHFPVGLEASEMIDAHDVHQFVEFGEALLPPAVVVRLHGGPVVLRVAPQLAGFAEIIRRYAGHHIRCSVSLEVE